MLAPKVDPTGIMPADIEETPCSGGIPPGETDKGSPGLRGDMEAGDVIVPAMGETIPGIIIWVEYVGSYGEYAIVP